MSRKFVCVTFICVVALGCSGPNAQLTSCQQDKDQLLTTIREQRDANHALQGQVASLEGRLDESEKELARRTTPGTRLSSRPVEESKLPWRSPSESSSSVASSKSQGKAAGGTLEVLAARDRRVTIDATSGVATLKTDVSFEENVANLTAQARRQLDEVAKLLKSKDAENLRVLVSGYAEGRPPKSGEGAFTSARQLGAARAQAVADYLDRHGIAEERLGVTGVGSRIAAGPGATKSPASGVQIFLAEPDAPLVGWGGPGGSGQTLWR